MPLENCPDCGHVVSSAAAACPNCGAPRKRNRRGWLIAAGFGVVLLLVVGVRASQDRTPASTAGPPPAEAVPASPQQFVDAAPEQRAPFVPEPAPVAPVRRNLCTEYGTQLRIDSLTRVIAKRVMPFARQIHGRNLGCSYFADAGIARVDLTVSWESTGGATPYWLNGTLDLGESTWEWKPGAASATLSKVRKDWEETKFWGTLVLGAAAAIAAASANQKASTGPATSGRAVTCIHNETAMKLYFKTRWNDQSSWKSDSIIPDERIRWRSPTGDTLMVSMDVALDDGADFRTIDLPGRRVNSSDPDCQTEGTYALRKVGNTAVFRRR